MVKLLFAALTCIFVAYMKALIYKSTGSWYVAGAEDGRVFNTRLKGIFKMDGLSSTNPVAVGDEVEIDLEDVAENTAIITHIYERKNYMVRASPHHRLHHHIIASNLDQALLFATLRDPRTSQGFIDRFLVSAEAYHIPAIVVFNKSDIYKKKELDKFEELKDMYEAIGYKIVLASMQTGQGAGEVKALLRDKTTLLSGHSGVGKSTFINTIFPEMGLRTSEVSGWSGKGMHTTTFAEMFNLPGGGKIIDTPGIREYGLVDIPKQELSHYFPEMRRILGNCQFNNCLHVNEPGCAVKRAAEAGDIAIERYVSYYNILETITETSY